MTLDERKQLKMKMVLYDIKSKDIVDYLKVSPSLISSFLSGRANMSLDNIQKLKNYIEGFEVEAGSN